MQNGFCGRIGLLVALLWPLALPAQQGARSDVNAPFRNPDVQRWQSNLESEGREVYAKRNEILAATAVKPGMAVADIGASATPTTTSNIRSRCSHRSARRSGPAAGWS